MRDDNRQRLRLTLASLALVGLPIGGVSVFLATEDLMLMVGLVAGLVCLGVAWLFWPG